MQQLLDALKRFGEDPATLGDNIFTLFHTITTMDWAQVTALGSAIEVLALEAFHAAEKRGDPAPTHDPTYLRLKGSLKPVIARAATLIGEAPIGRRDMMIEAVARRHGNGFVTTLVTDDWHKRFGASVVTQ